jgi:hypothetical protein
MMEHSHHQFRINRGSTHFRVKGREIGMNPRQIENRSNLANWVIVWNCLIKMKRIKQLLLVVIEPPHHRSPPHSESHDSDGTPFFGTINDFCNKICQKPTHALAAKTWQIEVEHFQTAGRARCENSICIRNP